MEVRVLDSGRSVLIVDESQETREVLQTALSRQCRKVLAARCAEEGLKLAREHHPDVIVLDLEIESASPGHLAGSFRAASAARSTPLILLGSAHRNGDDLPAAQFVAKPYHYGPLIRKIGELLDVNR